MICSRCTRSAALLSLPSRPITAALRPTQSQISPRSLPKPRQQSRTFVILRQTPSTRPTLSHPRTTTSSPLADDAPTSTFSLQPLASAITSLQQVRGAKRDTFNPSHVVRKRRHGFLARLRTRTGRMVIKRRKAKKRNTLSH